MVDTAQDLDEQRQLAKELVLELEDLKKRGLDPKSANPQSKPCSRQDAEGTVTDPSLFPVETMEQRHAHAWNHRFG